MNAYYYKARTTVIKNDAGLCRFLGIILIGIAIFLKLMLPVMICGIVIFLFGVWLWVTTGDKFPLYQLQKDEIQMLEFIDSIWAVKSKTFKDRSTETLCLIDARLLGKSLASPSRMLRLTFTNLREIVEDNILSAKDPKNKSELKNTARKSFFWNKQRLSKKEWVSKDILNN